MFKINEKIKKYEIDHKITFIRNINVIKNSHLKENKMLYEIVILTLKGILFHKLFFA